MADNIIEIYFETPPPPRENLKSAPGLHTNAIQFELLWQKSTVKNIYDFGLVGVIPTWYMDYWV